MSVLPLLLAATMVKRGRRKQRRTTRGELDTSTTQEVSLCGTCSKELDDTCIGCDKCETWVHGSVMCSGLPQAVIEAIHGYSGEDISYICMNCRVIRASGTSGSPSAKSESYMAETMSQLFQQMRGMCTVLMELANQVKDLSSQVILNQAEKTRPASQEHQTDREMQGKSQTRNQHNTDTGPSGEYRSVVRQELRELQERDKRKDSVVVRGLEASSPADLAARFAELTQTIMGKRVELSEVKAIPSHPDIYRAKIMNADDKKLVLDRAKNLRGTRYDKVFIRRDLTYSQRAELRERRLSKQSQQVSREEAETVRPGDEQVHRRVVGSNTQDVQSQQGK